MIKFFRKFRQRLLSKNLPSPEGTSNQASKFRKYLLYSLGEIILVVIGILIAISLNNSNQAQIRTTNSEEKLIKLRQLIYEDSVSMSRTITRSKSIVKQIETAIALLDKDMTNVNYKIIMNNVILRSGPRTTPPDRSIYDEMLNSGEFSHIRDNKLKQRIATYYTHFEHFTWIIKSYSENSELSGLTNSIYQEDIIRKRHLEAVSNDGDLNEGLNHFRNSIKKPINYGRFENYAYSRKDFHDNIILYHEILTKNYLNGLSIKPD